jgi:outer membrane protein OmpA-like peptidoglycan-associated protein
MPARPLRAPLAAVLVLAGLTATAATAPNAAGPWDPATEAAAEAAVARLGNARALDVRPSVLAIVGLGGAGTGVVATVQQVRQAMQDLGAKETAIEVRVELPADVLFDFDKADIRADAAAALAKVATIIRAYPAGSVTLEGHTDAKGDDAYNQGLSERRAQSVRAWLVEKERIAGAKMAARGWGERRPVASNDTDPGRQKNRRVEVVIRKGR